MTNALVNAVSGNPLRPSFTTTGFQFYDTWVRTIVTQTEFRNFRVDPNNVPPSPLIGSGGYNGYNYAIIAMTHSDVYKPQGISATKRITFTNCDDSTVLGIGRSNTGSSWGFNVVDYDGSLAKGLVGNVATVFGSFIPFWRYKSTCVNKWDVWVCPKGTHEIANIYQVIPGRSDPNFPNPGNDNSVPVGQFEMFGDGGPLNRTIYFTSQPGVTGISDRGWFMRFNNSQSPTTMQIYAYNFPVGRSIVICIPYPVSTTFVITAKYQWWTGYDLTLKNDTLANFQTNNSNAGKYYWDKTNGYLYLKIQNNVAQNPPYVRDGATLYELQNSFYFTVTANCATATGPALPGQTATYPYCSGTTTSAAPTQLLSMYPSY